MDTVFIEGLSIDTVIGIHAWERKIRQPVLLDVTLAFDPARAAASGKLADTLDYASVAGALTAFVSASACGLLEQLAEGCCALLQERFPAARGVDLRLSKPAAARALGCASVGVRVQRQFA